MDKVEDYLLEIAPLIAVQKPSIKFQPQAICENDSNCPVLKCVGSIIEWAVTLKNEGKLHEVSNTLYNYGPWLLFMNSLIALALYMDS